ncbi:MAG: vanadium-dependent haloperoxidase [Candidatus Hydrogenedentota bacterium]
MRSFGRIAPGAALVVLATVLTGCPVPNGSPATENIAQEWNALLRDAIAAAGQGPTIESRTMFHASAAMYEAWAAYDPIATGYFTGSRLKRRANERTLANRAEAISHAVYGISKHRFGDSAKGTQLAAAFDAIVAKMQRHDYLDPSGEPNPSNAQRLGSLIAEIVLDYAANDDSNEENGYADTFGYVSLNTPIIPTEAGTNNMEFANHWQEIIAEGGAQQHYLTPHWGSVTPFALPNFNPVALRIDPGRMPEFGTDTQQGFIDDMVEVLRFSSLFDPADGPGSSGVNLSPRLRGLGTPGYSEAEGHPINPYTRGPYGDNIVPLGDYLRAISTDHDGLEYGTPTPWWNEVAANIMSGQGVVSRRAANKPRPANLEYDVKLFFTLNAALHDVAIAIWDIKFVYDSCRPISGIRYLADIGLLPIEEGFVEIIQPGDPLAGETGENIGKIKVRAWAEPNQGVQWMLGTEWVPYWPANFVTPPFPGYCSGHSAFSRAAAEVLTAMTGDPFFPGGLAELPVDSLRFEDDLSAPITLQWATYRDMADETALARVTSGAHIPSDVLASRPIGAQIAEMVLDLTHDYFGGRGVAVAKEYR